MRNPPIFLVDTRQPDADNLAIRVVFCRFKVCANSYADAVKQIELQYPHLDILDPRNSSPQEEVLRQPAPAYFGAAANKQEGALEYPETVMTPPANNEDGDQ